MLYKDNKIAFVENETDHPKTVLLFELCALKAMGYRYKTKIKQEKKLRGITKGTLKNIRFDKYIDCLFKKPKKGKQYNIMPLEIITIQ